MKLAIVCDERLKNEILAKKISEDVSLDFVSAPHEISDKPDAIMDLLFENSPTRVSQLKQFLPRPVFINAVEYTLADIGEPFIRINAWPTFLQRKTSELAAFPAQEPIIKEVFEKIKWAYQLVPDKAGMVSVRIIAGIINEAYHALGEKISSREEIDTAMKTGTNYPFGPFEWAGLIGVKKIYAILTRLSHGTGSRSVAPMLATEAFAESH